jgi:hypothetical protein
MRPAPNHEREKLDGGILPTLKVPSQCPFVLLVEVSLRDGKSLGSEGRKELGSGLCYEQRKEVEQGLCFV